MMVQIRDLFQSDEARDIREALLGAQWNDGRETAGAQSAKVKRNRQLAEDHPLAVKLGDEIIKRLSQHGVFMSAALPRKVFPPLFNAYSGGEHFGFHIDNAVRKLKNSPERVRTDVSATLFLSEPDQYDGGELIIQDTFGTQEVKLPAGHMVVYPGSSLHRVAPVTRGVRLASFFWVQSLVREDSQRALLFDMDLAIQSLTRDVPDHPSLVSLTGSYHNLLRRWSEV